MISVIADTNTFLDNESTRLETRKATVQTKIDSLQGQLDALRLELVDIGVQQDYVTRIRQFVSDLAAGFIHGGFFIPGAPPPTGTPEPIGPGITMGVRA